MADQPNEVWMRKIEVQHAEVVALLNKLDERMQEANEWRDKVDLILHGDGNGHRGHHVRLDRLEQAQERQKWIMRSLLVPVALLAAKALAGILGVSG